MLLISKFFLPEHDLLFGMDVYVCGGSGGGGGRAGMGGEGAGACAGRRAEK